MENTTTKSRLISIDILRGIVMVIMALDHVRDYVHVSAAIQDPLDANTTTVALYFTRWITHLCAPSFVLLSGISIYLQSLVKTKKELASFLIKRGIWLIVVEILIISFGWSFDPFFHGIALQVIWAIGVSMLLMGILMYAGFTYQLFFITGTLIVLGHNSLDYYESSNNFTHHFLIDLLHSSRFNFYEIFPQHYLIIVYPFLPWLGLMMLGFAAGKLYSKEFDVVKRIKILLFTGIALICLFILLRTTNIYGNPTAWSIDSSLTKTLFSYFNVAKYPPSLQFFCITVGIAFVLLALIEKYPLKFLQVFSVYGKTAFFYYIIHIYLIHLIATILFFARGYSLEQAITYAQQSMFLFVVPGVGFSLLCTYITWLIVVIVLYPVCKQYAAYKYAHKKNWWLSYL